MSTDLATTAPNGLSPALASVTTDAMSRLNEWVAAASQAHQLVAPLIDGAFVPDNFKPRVAQNASDEEREYAAKVALANATSAVLLGLNLGLDPLTALQQIILIKNRPGMYAKAKVAILTSRGYDIWTKELTDEKAVVCVVRPNTGGRLEEFEVTMAMAKKAGWTSNDNYAKTPQDMLYARAAGRACDRTGAHILLGIATAEDIPDTIEVQAHVGPRVTSADIIASAQPAADVPPAAPAEPERVEVGPSPAAMRRMFALLKEAGLEDKDLGLEFIRQTIGREIESRKELTRAEVSLICDKLADLTSVAEPPADGAA